MFGFTDLWSAKPFGSHPNEVDPIFKRHDDEWLNVMYMNACFF